MIEAHHPAQPLPAARGPALRALLAGAVPPAPATPDPARYVALREHLRFFAGAYLLWLVFFLLLLI